MPNATLAEDRTHDEAVGLMDRSGEGPGTPSTGGRWIVGLIPVVGTLALVFLLSPGLRSDLGGLVALLDSIAARPAGRTPARCAPRNPKHEHLHAGAGAVEDLAGPEGAEGRRSEPVAPLFVGRRWFGAGRRTRS